MRRPPKGLRMNLDSKYQAIAFLSERQRDMTLDCIADKPQTRPMPMNDCCQNDA